MRRSLCALALIVSMIAAAGCGGQPDNRAFSKVGQAVNQPPAPAGDQAAKAEAKADGPALDEGRRIIYNASLDLVVENMEKADQALRLLVGERKGAYVAKAEIRGAPGAPRSGSWTLRVPAGQFDTFRLGVRQLGEVQQDSLDSQDITEQFFDLDARMKNNLARAEGLRKLLEKAAQNRIEDYLAVQQKLDQVTADLDVQKGQLQRLDKLSTLATVTVTMHERKDFAQKEAPRFATRVGRSFGDSLEALQALGEMLAIVGAALLPWSPLIAAVGMGLWWLGRRQTRPLRPIQRAAAAPWPPPTPEGPPEA